MPEKSLGARVKAAKKKGTPVMLKDSDVGGAAGRSTHSVKKSRGIAAVEGRAMKATFEDRNVSSRRSPGMGKRLRSKQLPVPEGRGSSSSRRKTLPTEAAAGYRKDGTPKRPSSEAGARRKAASARGTDVLGRKKAPSQLGVKRKGGPRKSLPLHGG
jgi:hypothetical protein